VLCDLVGRAIETGHRRPVFRERTSSRPSWEALATRSPEAGSCPAASSRTYRLRRRVSEPHPRFQRPAPRARRMRTRGSRSCAPGGFRSGAHASGALNTAPPRAPFLHPSGAVTSPPCPSGTADCNLAASPPRAGVEAGDEGSCTSTVRSWGRRTQSSTRPAPSPCSSTSTRCFFHVEHPRRHPEAARASVQKHLSYETGPAKRGPHLPAGRQTNGGVRGNTGRTSWLWMSRTPCEGLSAPCIERRLRLQQSKFGHAVATVPSSRSI